MREENKYRWFSKSNFFFLDWLVAASGKEDVQSVPPLDGLMGLERKPF